MSPLTLRNSTLAMALSFISGLAMAQAPAPIPPQNLPPSPPTGMPIDNPQQRALVSCEAKPVADRDTCRDRVNAHYNAVAPDLNRAGNECSVLTGVALDDCVSDGSR